MDGHSAHIHNARSSAALRLPPVLLKARGRLRLLLAAKSGPSLCYGLGFVRRGEEGGLSCILPRLSGKTCKSPCYTLSHPGGREMIQLCNISISGMGKAAKPQLSCTEKHRLLNCTASYNLNSDLQ